ncbi:MAG TPA: hypothetical protein VFZ48_02750 [Candidatus Saccharimonadales bacterium]
MPRKLDEGQVVLYAIHSERSDAEVLAAETEIIKEVGRLKYWTMSDQERWVRLMEKLGVKP